jgi:hypothetical protein
MHPYLNFYDKQIAQHLKGKAQDMRKVLEALLSGGKRSFFIVIVGTLNVDQNGQNILPLPMLFDNLINSQGFDGKLIVVDSDASDFKALADRTSDKTTLIHDDFISVLHGLSISANVDIDLLFLGSSNDEIEDKSVATSKSMKAIPVIQDVLSDNSILVIDEEQKNRSIGQEIENVADEYEKQPILSSVLSGWRW